MSPEHSAIVSLPLAALSLGFAAGCAASAPVPTAGRSSGTSPCAPAPQPASVPPVPSASSSRALVPPAGAGAEAQAAELVWALRAHENRTARLSPDGRKAWYTSSRGGRWAVYQTVLDAPERVPEQQWRCPRRCWLGGWRPGGKLEIALDAGDGLDRYWLEPAQGLVEPAAAASRSVERPAASSGPTLTVRDEPCGQRVWLAAGATTERPVELPLGVGQTGPAGARGHLLSLTWETPLSPADIFAVDDRTGALVRLRNEVRPAFAALSEAVVEMAAPGGAPALLLRPRHAARALVVAVGAAGRPAAAFDPVARILAGRGVAVLVPCRRGGRPPAALLSAFGRWSRRRLASGGPLLLANAGPAPGAVDGPVPAPFGAAVELPWWRATGGAARDRARRIAALLQLIASLGDGS